MESDVSYGEEFNALTSASAAARKFTLRRIG
jgi:hypothetical protein